MSTRLTVSIAVALAATTAGAEVPIGHQRGAGPLRRGSTAFVRQGQPLRLVLEQKQRAPACLRWYHVVPQARGYDNRRHCQTTRARPCAQPIAYRHEELPRLRNHRRVEISAVAALRRPGTHWLTVRPCGRPPGPVSTTGRPTAFALVVRRADGYVGRLTELLGVPYVFAPMPVEGGHQTDQRLGADCVSLVAYGRRRLGRKTPYLSLSQLTARTRTRTLARARSLQQLLKRRPQVRPGDLIHLRTHVAVVSRDNEPAGLGPEDLVLHALDGSAEEIPAARLRGGAPVLLLRWGAGRGSR